MMLKYTIILIMVLNIFPASGKTTITIDTTQRFQTIDGWEAVTNLLEVKSIRDKIIPHIPKLIDLAVNEVGINRLRLGVKSGLENPVDYFNLLRADSITYDEYKTTRYFKINDNDDPYTADPAGFQMSILDTIFPMMILPMKEAVEKRGEKFYLNICFVDFANQSPFHHSGDPEEYAEFMTYIYTYIDTAFGIRADGLEVILEPDNAEVWHYTDVPDMIASVGRRLENSGYQPEIIAPSVMNLRNVPGFMSSIADNEEALSYLDVISYHRYSGNNDTLAQNEIVSLAKQYNKKTAMLEYDKNGDAEELHYDLKYNNVTAWTKYALMYHSDQLFTYVFVDAEDPDNPKYDIAKQTKILRQYFKFIRPGAVRIEASADVNKSNPVAFKNPDGREVVVIQSKSADTIIIEGLQAGEYGIKYTLGNYDMRNTAIKEYDIDLDNQFLTENQSLKFFMPDKGVVTVYQLSGINSVKNSGVEDNIKIFPNPSSSYIIIETKSQQSKKYVLCDILGKELSSGNFDSIKKRIDISHLTEGIYILRIDNKSFKIIKI